MASVVGWAVSSLGIVASLAWVGQVLAVFRDRKGMHWLADLPDAIPAGDWPGLAVIFAARNEAAGIERAARSILAQDYPALAVIAVDDRSTDATGAILDELAREDPRLRVVHVCELPPGWLGKLHALHVAAAAESSPWLLFTDADVQFAPGALRRAVAWAMHVRADHVTVVPEFVTEGVGERLFLMTIALAFAVRVLGGRVAAPRGRTHLGVGAFNLVRTEAFRRIDGFEHLALSIDDDNRLAQALKAAGYRGRAIMGSGAISVRWQIGLAGLIRGLEKNLFAFLDYRTGLAALVCLAWLGLGVAPYAGLFVGPWWTRAICALGIAALAVILSAARRQTGIAWYYALAFPLGVALYTLALFRSICLTLRRRGVRWRDCHYQLDELREHVGWRNAWLREMRRPAG
jgi:hypothetical protein